MIRGNKEFMKQWIMHPLLRKKIKEYKSDDLVCDIMVYSTWLSNQQNKTFHTLLSCYWSSGCCSDEDYEALRSRFKKLVGLITVSETTAGNYKVIQEKEVSWSKVKKEDATIAIKSLIDEMFESGVNTPAFQRIMIGLGDIFPDAKVGRNE